jgi:RNA polymerase sigma-70 factor (ECF subfamily)
VPTLNQASAADAAFERWVLPELESVYRAALAITGDRYEAEDLVQDTLLRAYRGIGGFDGSKPRAWLFTILRNTHVNRHRRRRPGLLGDPAGIEALCGSSPGAEEVIADRLFDARVEVALAALPDEQRRVVELVDVAGLSYAEAAGVTGVPVGTVMSRLHRGRRRMRRHLADVIAEVVDGEGVRG